MKFPGPIDPEGRPVVVSIGRLNEKQERALRPYVAGWNVHDLGAGNLGMAKKLVELGAHTVTAVDRCYSDPSLNNFNECEPWCAPTRVKLVAKTFEEYDAEQPFIDMAFVCWPEVYETRGLERLVARASVVAYLGTNVNGSACGSVELFTHLQQREVLVHVPDTFNTLIVYGVRLNQSRQLLQEELGALRREHGIIYV